MSQPAASNTTASQATSPRVAHQPYGTPVIPVAAMSENTRQFYEAMRVRSGSSSSASSSASRSHSRPRSPPDEAEAAAAAASWQHTPSSAAATHTPPSSHHSSQDGTPTSAAMAPVAAGRYPPLPPLRAPQSQTPPAEIIPRRPSGKAAMVSNMLHPELRDAGLRWCPHPPQSRVPEPPRPRFHCTRLFLGQLPFELTPAQIRHLIYTVTGVETLRLDPRSAGCFMAYYASDADAARVKVLAGTILFDQEGAWVATTPDQLEALRRYQQKIRVWTSFFLPRTALIVEDERKAPSAE